MTNITEAILQHTELLNSYARKLTHDRDTARDLCQETMFKALANGTKFTHGTDLRPWLFTIMRNLFINGYRRKKLEKKLFSRRFPEMTAYADTSTHTYTTAHIELKEMQSAIDAMPPTLSVPIRLYCEGYKYQEIADMTATALGTTKSRIHMARQLLRERADRDLHHRMAG